MLGLSSLAGVGVVAVLPFFSRRTPAGVIAANFLFLFGDFPAGLLEGSGGGHDRLDTEEFAGDLAIDTV